MECGAEAGKEGHHNADEKDDEGFRWEVPGQASCVNKRQENRQAKRVVHGHCTIYLQR